MALITTNLAAHDHPTLFRRPDTLRDPLYVVTPVINAARFRTRWKHYEDFRKHVAESGAILFTVEVAFGDREFVVTSKDNPFDIQLRTWHESWLKERAINIGTGFVTRYDPGWRYVSWIDADCHFVRYDWADETRHLLQHYPIIQMWSQLEWLNSHYEISGHGQSFMSVKTLGDRLGTEPDGYYKPKLPQGPRWGSPGLAWAARRETWDQLGGLIDFAILGAGDWYFALALHGELESSLRRKDATKPFMRKLVAYQERVRDSKWQERSIQCNAGLMRGLVVHFWHGRMSDRQYKSRAAILGRANFDPDLDLKPDHANFGLWQLTNRNPVMRREIQDYFKARNEDSVE